MFKVNKDIIDDNALREDIIETTIMFHGVSEEEARAYVTREVVNTIMNRMYDTETEEIQGFNL